MPNTFDFITDPGHGWLKVSKAELARVGVENDITSYSYSRGDYAYLEEDVDYATFLRAREARGEPFTVRNRNADYRESRVRRYPSYVAPNPRYLVDGRRYATLSEAKWAAEYIARSRGVVVAIEERA